MANQRHVDILLRDGVRVWNLWRKEEPDTRLDLSKADLHEANLNGANLSEANLNGANLRRADLYNANLTRANLSEADLTRAYLSEANLTGANLSEADLTRAYLTGAHLHEANLHKANLHKANLSRANLSEANLIEANLIDTDLSFLHLREADLSGADLSGTNLRGADLTGADLHEADLSGANLSWADLSGANLREAKLYGTNLREANLSGADLSGANLSGALCLMTTFSGATLTGSNVYGIAAWDVDLDGAKQADLRIRSLYWGTNITVDNLEVAQFLYLLLTNEKVRSVLDTITSKVVLILGRFSEERKPVLDALREALRSHPNGYIPVLFDFDPQHDKPVFETVKTIANLARFVIADLTDPNMVRSELTYITANLPTVPVQPVMQSGANLPTEYGTWKRYTSFLPVYRYDSLTHLLANLTDAVIAPVEGHVVARRLADADSIDTLS